MNCLLTGATGIVGSHILYEWLHTALTTSNLNHLYVVIRANQHTAKDRLLQILNDSLEGLEASKTNFKADVNVNYRIKDFSINTMLTFGDYTNLNFGINYNIN